MGWITATWLRLKALLLRRRFDRDLEDEMAFHLSMREEKQRSAGMQAGDAHYSARRGFGNVVRIKEACREMRTFMSFESFLQDVRYGLRGLRKAPGFAAVAVITLAVGIGTSSWCFNMVRQWVLQAVTFPDSERLTVVWEIDTKKGYIGRASAPDFLDWREQSHEFGSLSGWSVRQFNLTGVDVPERIAGARVSADFFRTLGVVPQMGRDFLTEEDQTGRGHVAIVSYGFWHERLNHDQDLGGKALMLDGERYDVIGVMPEKFHFTLMGRTNIWVPLALTEKERSNRSLGWLNVIGRLKPQLPLKTARQSMSVIARQLEKQYPDSNTNSGVLLRSLSDEIGKHTGEQGIYSGFLMGICILLIVCTNIASVYLARALLRRKEMTVRMALGAGKPRLARQLLVESLLVVPAAIALGLGFALLGAKWTTSAIPFDNRGYLPNYGEVYMDAATFLFATGVSLVSVLLFTLAPVMETRKLDLTGSLKETTTSSSTGLGGRRLRKLLVVGQIVLALVVLVPAALSSRSLRNMVNEDPGFTPDHVLTAKMNLPPAGYHEPAQMRAFVERLVERLRALPQVQSASVSASIPFGHSYGGAEIWIEGRPDPKPGEVAGMAINPVTPEYLTAVGLHLVRGRFIQPDDAAMAPPVIVINQTLAQRFFPDQDPLNHKVRFSREDPVARTIVGIVRDVKIGSMADDPSNQAYVSMAQSPSSSLAVAIRSGADPATLVAGLRQAVAALDPEQPISDVLPLAQRISDEEAPFKIFAQFTACFALLALFLAAIGIYGVLAYLVENRSREIGIRMACGARPKAILWLVLSGSMRLVLAGLSIGLVLAWFLARLGESLLYRVTASDPSTYVLSVAVIFVAVVLASLVPLRRATKVDPMIVLRYE